MLEGQAFGVIGEDLDGAIGGRQVPAGGEVTFYFGHPGCDECGHVLLL